MTTFIQLALYILVIVLVAWLIKEYGKRQAEEARKYDFLYSQIQGYIDGMDICPANYEFIQTRIDQLGKLKYKNKEKTAVLTDAFYRKFGGEYAKRVLKDHEKKMKNTCL